LEKRQLLQQIVLENWLSTCRRDTYLSLDKLIKINSKWIKDLNVRPETLKILEENVGKTFQDIRIGYDFLNRTPIVLEMIGKIYEWYCIKLKIFSQKNKQLPK
jgi:hypothetical protein